MNDVVEPGSVAAASTAAECDWPVTNCYIDAWTQILQAWGMEPLAGLGITVAQDYEGDQFTFFKYLHEDLEHLYGVVVGELSIWHTLDVQIEVQTRRGHLVLVEVDGYYLPDTRATSYRMQHTKTTIGVDKIDLAAGHLTYFHNAGYYELTGEDYAGVFRRLPGQDSPDVLPPYAEFVRRRFPPLRDAALTEAAVTLLKRHLRRRPEESPIRRYRAEFPQQMEWLMAHPAQFHEYAFNVFRQLGANFQLLGAHVQWLGARGVRGLAPVAAPAAAISATAKALQFKVARIANRRRFDPCDAMFDALEKDYDTVIEGLSSGLGD